MLDIEQNFLLVWSILDLVLLNQQVFSDPLHRIELSCCLLLDKKHFAKRAFVNHSENFEIFKSLRNYVEIRSCLSREKERRSPLFYLWSFFYDVLWIVRFFESVFYIVHVLLVYKNEVLKYFLVIFIIVSTLNILQNSLCFYPLYSARHPRYPVCHILITRLVLTQILLRKRKYRQILLLTSGIQPLDAINDQLHPSFKFLTLASRTASHVPSSHGEQTPPPPRESTWWCLQAGGRRWTSSRPCLKLEDLLVLSLMIRRWSVATSM